MAQFKKTPVEKLTVETNFPYGGKSRHVTHWYGPATAYGCGEIRWNVEGSWDGFAGGKLICCRVGLDGTKAVLDALPAQQAAA